DRSAWGDAGRHIYADALSNWHIITPAILLIGVLLVTRRSLKARLAEIAALVAQIQSDRFGLTLEALFLTLLLAGLWPGAMAFMGWRLFQAADAPDAVKALGNGLMAASILLFGLELLRQICRKHGLADAHFRWRSGNLKVVRRNVAWLMPVMVP